MVTFVNVINCQWRELGRLCALDAVGGWVFTRRIEHTFEKPVSRTMQEVLL
jgi:hypothetical protein